jgi:hypothetical protein
VGSKGKDRSSIPLSLLEFARGNHVHGSHLRNIGEEVVGGLRGMSKEAKESIMALVIKIKSGGICNMS